MDGNAKDVYKVTVSLTGPEPVDITSTTVSLSPAEITVLRRLQQAAWSVPAGCNQRPWLLSIDVEGGREVPSVVGGPSLSLPGEHDVPGNLDQRLIQKNFELHREVSQLRRGIRGIVAASLASAEGIKAGDDEEVAPTAVDAYADVVRSLNNLLCQVPRTPLS